ncbi:cation:proton antiporter [Thermodesulfobacterium sp. TA1]|uniref:cation:proton antiporter n=1 Tax=Thermodesulfobacterium sp. TA1 TaxID=2234087 RepID=UPI001232EB35|nr:cation:proton antiporter [Thermodesulfobacterium sp. TA1]QER42014.1 cation:proton antiporter [Thermodesulfobacterium sp. TA1]
MDQLWYQATIWFFLAFIASLISFRLAISAALIELIVGIIAGNTIHPEVTPWVNFLASFGAVILTFLAGAELETEVIKNYWKEAVVLGLVGFFAPFFGAWAISQFVLGWGIKQAQLAGIALSTTSVAVVYAVMVETGLNEKPLGKLILAACFVNDLGTVIALGLLFTKLGAIFWLFVVITLGVLFILPFITKRYFAYVKNHPSEPEVKFIFVVLCILGFLASKAGSEAVLPAYLVGAVLANLFLKNRELVKRMRASTIALLTPFYFLKAGSLVDLKAVWEGLGILTVLLLAKVVSKFLGLYPTGMVFKFPFRLNMYNTLLMSTGLTFGTISALYGLRNGIIDKNQYSLLVVAVILSAIIPTFIAQKFFYPRKREMDMKFKNK